MQRPAPVLVLAATILIAGGSCLAALIWRELELGSWWVPHLVGAVIGGVTLRRIHDRHAIVFAASGALAGICLQLLVDAPHWAPYTRTEGYALLAAAPACAALAAALPLPNPRETRLRWLWVSAVLTLGFMIAATTLYQTPDGVAFDAIMMLLLAPMFAGALTQYLAPCRMVWTCGGGSVFLLLRLVEGPGALANIVSCICACSLLGAGGAALAWRLFRREVPRSATLPVARVR